MIYENQFRKMKNTLYIKNFLEFAHIFDESVILINDLWS